MKNNIETHDFVKGMDKDISKKDMKINTFSPKNSYLPDIEKNILKKTVAKKETTTVRVFKDTSVNLNALTDALGNETICDTINQMIDVFLDTLSEEEKKFFEMSIKIQSRK